MSLPTTRHAVLLRALNVGGTGKLSMDALRKHCRSAGFDQAKTYLATGNVIVESQLSAQAIKKKLHQELISVSKPPVGLFVYSEHELQALLEQNPFADHQPSRTIIQFLDAVLDSDIADDITGQQNEEIAVGPGVLYVYYPNGQGQSRLRFRQSAQMTGRNLNTVRRLLKMIVD